MSTNFFFEIAYLVKADTISWNFYPSSKDSTKDKKEDRVLLVNALQRKNLMNDFLRWKSNLVELETIDNPLEFFNIDDFVKFYAGEFIGEFVITEKDEIEPLSFAQKSRIIGLISKQSKFLDNEISTTTEMYPEKLNDLKVSKDVLEQILIDMPRMTVSEVKRNLALPLGAIRKWCEDKYIAFLLRDKESDYELSRSLGSFIGGLFGVPKIGD
ncbi:MAG: hypothetical protein AB8B74_10710 [Crocinitomicaceae bacterium]